MNESPADFLVEISKQRQRTFWGRQPESYKRCQLIAAAGNLLIEAQYVQSELGRASTVSEMVERYTETDHPWCEFDTAQRQVFHNFVNTKIEEGRIAYFLVDAMRYEMGCELWRALSSEGEANISGAIASVPTITEIGMASLLPEAENGVEIVDAGGGKLALKVGEEVLGNRAQRMEFLKEGGVMPSLAIRFRLATSTQHVLAPIPKLGCTG